MATTRILRAISGAALAGALALASAPGAVADEVRGDQWPLASLDAEAVGKISKGRGETVAVIDDGVNANHVDLKGNVLKGRDFEDDDSSTTPASGDTRGTGMASLIAGHGHGKSGADGIMGLAPEASILPLRDSGDGDKGFAESIRYAVDHDASVINISSAGKRAPDPAEKNSITYALKHDVLVVASVGDSQGDVEYPAAYPGVLTATGTKEDGKSWLGANSGPGTLLAAPGVQVLSAGGDSDTSVLIGDSTIYATAYVSAAAALVRAEHPDFTAGQVANRLTRTAYLPDRDDATQLPDPLYGYGSIRPLKALTTDIAKGSKWGPLPVDFLKKGSSASGREGSTSQDEDARVAEQQDQKQLLFLTLTGVVVLVVLGLAALVIVLVVKKRKRQRGFAGPGSPGSAAPMPGQFPAQYPGQYPGQAPVPGPYDPGAVPYGQPPQYGQPQSPGYGQPPHQQQPMPPAPAPPPPPPQQPQQPPQPPQY